MSQTHNQVEVDLDRKEELILAKQLRACRVQILPKAQLSPPIDKSKSSRSSVSPLPSPSTPARHSMPSSSSEPQKQERVVMQELQSKMARAASLMAHHSPPASVQMSPGQGPAIVIQSPEDRVSQAPPVFSVSKLPFLADIKRLRQSPTSSPSPAPVAVCQPKPESLAPAESQTVNPHLGYLENRPKISEFPFLNDIKKLRKDPVQTPSINSPNPDTAPILEYEPVKPLIPIDRREIDASHTAQAPKTVRFSASDPERSDGSGNYQTEDKLVPAENIAEDNPDYSESRMSKSQKAKRSSRVNFKIDEKTNVKKLADQMIPQMNSMQKNFLGLLFFNELSPHIVDDIVAQQLSMMPGSKLASILSSLDPQASLTSLNLMLNSINDEGRLSLLCENFSYLSSEERAGVLFSTADDVKYLNPPN